MAKTKTTPVKKCPMCTFRTANIDDMKEHILKCGIETMEKKTLSCPKCSYKTFRPTNMTRHQKRHDATVDVPKAAGKSLNTALSSKNSEAHSPETDVESWKGQDPGDLTDPYEPELRQQPVNRKTVTKTTRYSDNGRDVELVEYCEFFGAEALDRSY
ncbi:uncharacterized protein [Argopecten irradians]|uniref:uncharacterized protein n=1 Tax=Argopecten irradians TaxID=31199 RepID=UPI00371D87E0